MSSSELRTFQVQREIANIAAGVAGDQNFIAGMALPQVKVNSENFIYRLFDNSQFHDVETLRQIGNDPNKINLKFSTANGSLNEHMLDAFLDDREIQAFGEPAAQDQALKDLRLAYSTALRSQVMITKEQEAAAVLQTAANFNSGNNVTTDANFGSTGIRDTILAKKDAVQGDTGRKPNIGVAGKITHRLLLKNADIVDAIKYSRGGITTNQLIAEYLELDMYLVGEATTQTAAAAGAVGTDTSIWTEDAFSLYYASPSPGIVSPSFAYNFFMDYPRTGGPVWVGTRRAGNDLGDELRYGERTKAALVFGAAGWFFSNTDQA